MIRFIASLSIAVTLLSGFFWPAETSEPDPLGVMLARSEAPPATIDAMSAAVVSRLNAAASGTEPAIRGPLDPITPVPEDAFLVRPGDSLYSIALAAFGTTRAHRAIYDANRDRITDPARLEAGLVLRLPKRY